jgi:hypothetical protein
MPLHDYPQFRVQIEADRITLSCQDDRLIAEGLNEEFRDYVHKRVTASYVEEFLERLTAEFWQAGCKEGRNQTIGEIRKIDESIRSLLGKKE